jgi:multiple sugar transport system permease protein
MAGAQTTPIPASLRTSASASSAAGARPRRQWVFESAYLYLLPAGLLILFVFGYPTMQSILLSVQRNKGIRDPGRFIGIDNFVELSRSPIFWQVTWQTFVWTIGVVGVTTVLAFILAVILNQNFTGKAIFRTLVILPAATSLAVSAMVWKYAFDPNGLVNHTLSGFGSTDNGIPWLADNPQAMAAIIFVGILVSVPLTAVMIAASMRSIPRDLYEAAALDGASRLSQTMRITLPLSRTMILITTLANFVVAFNSFPIIFVMTNGGPINRTDILATYLYQEGFQILNFGLASALAVVVLVILLVLSLGYVHLLIHRTKVG